MCCCEKQCGSICVCVFLETAKSLLNPQEVLCWLWAKRQEDKRGTWGGGRGDVRGRGIPAHVSSRHKWRKLATLLFLIMEVQPIHVQPPPNPPTMSCRERCCGLQMLEPAVGLLGHTDLQPFQHSNEFFQWPLQLFFFFSPWSVWCGVRGVCLHMSSGVTRGEDRVCVPGGDAGYGYSKSCSL